MRMLASHQCEPGFTLDRCHEWIEFVIGSYLALRVFFEFSSFSPSTKPTLIFPYSNLTWIDNPHENQLLS